MAHLYHTPQGSGDTLEEGVERSQESEVWGAKTSPGHDTASGLISSLWLSAHHHSIRLVGISPWTPEEVMRLYPSWGINSAADVGGGGFHSHWEVGSTLTNNLSSTASKKHSGHTWREGVKEGGDMEEDGSRGRGKGGKRRSGLNCYNSL